MVMMNLLRVAQFYSIVYCLGEFAFAAANIEFTKYSGKDGFTCMTNTSFIDTTKGLSKMQCSLKCSRQFSCRGVIYDSALPSCIGCQWYTSDRISEFHSNTEKFFSREVYKLVTENKNWWEAKGHCESLGGRLADIHSAAEQNFIEDNILPTSVNLYWIGGMENSSDFVWLDGTSASTGYHKWFPGQPDKGEGGQYQYCMMLYQRDDNTTYTWDDAPCDSSSWMLGSLCEFE